MLLELAVAGVALSVIRRRNKQKRLSLFLKPHTPAMAAALRQTESNSVAEKTFTAKERPWSNSQFTLSALSLGVSAVGDALCPPLSLLSLPGTVYVTRALYRQGFRSVVRERKATVDVLLIVVNLLSLANGYFFLFCLNSFIFLCARNLLDKVKQDSRADYIDIFRQQARTVGARRRCGDRNAIGCLAGR
jgi:hypothetical protein